MVLRSGLGPYYWLPKPHLSESGQPLTGSECHRPMLSTINKAQSIAKEITKSKVSLFTRKWKFQGDSSEFYVLLSSTRDQIPAVLTIEVPNLGDESLENLLRDLLEVNDDFKESSARLNGLVLRISKNFDQNVIEPLKKAMISKRTPDYPILKRHTIDCQQQFMKALEMWREEVQGLSRQIMATETWHEEVELNKKTNDLLLQARRGGWDFDDDPNWKELKDLPIKTRDRLNRRNRFLNSMLNGDKKKSSTTSRLNFLVEED